MPSRPRPAATPGSNRGRAGRRPRQRPTTARRTTLVGASAATPQPPSRAKFTGRAAILFLVMLVLAVSYASSARAWLRQRSEISDLNAQIAASQAAVSGLEKTKQRWHDPAYIKEQARCRFNWVLPGETGYSVIDANGNPLSCAGTSTLSNPVAPTTGSTDSWYQSAWGSVVEAGQDPAEVAAKKKAGPHPAKRIGANVQQDSHEQGKPSGATPSGR